MGVLSNKHRANSPVVRPPVLGGNEKMGVFATRSSFSPNNIGLSSVRLSRVEWDGTNGPIIHVKGADLMDGTPIYDSSLMWCMPTHIRMPEVVLWIPESGSDWRLWCLWM